MASDNHDERGWFATGSGASGTLAGRMARFVTNAGVDARHDWMGKTSDRAEKHAAASRAQISTHHSTVPTTFGRR